MSLLSEAEPLYHCELTKDTADSLRIPVPILPSCYADYTDVFSEEADSTLPLHQKDLDHTINLKLSCTAPFRPLYNLSEYKLSVLKKYIDKNLKSEFITRSKSAARALILFIKKKDGSLRLCVNY